MDINYLRTLYDYNYWAHSKVWTCIEGITEEQFTRDMGHSWGSIRGQIVHLMSAEWVWVSRLLGNSPTAHLSVEEFSTRDKIKAKWQTVESDVRHYLSQIDNDKLNQPFSYTMMNGSPQTTPIWQILFHLLNHGTDHRAQLLAMLHRLDAPTVEQDMILYFRERSS